MASFDYVSDLHIDYWDPKWRTLYMNIGNLSDFPLNWNNMNKKSDTLIVAGDVSDKLEYTIEYLKELKKYYKKILFVDGNHEHTYQFPNLYKRDYIASKFKDIENIHYLPKENIIVDNTAFVGVCGWWDYGCQENNENMQGCINFLKDNLDDQKVILAKNIVERAKKEALKLNKKIEKFEKNPAIEDIVIVTHTIPLPKYARIVEFEYNNFFKDLNIYNQNTKVKRWVFGHTHDEWLDQNFGIKMMCHPRGRPADHNRESYKVRTSTSIK